MLKYYKCEHIRDFEYNIPNSNVVCTHSVARRISFSFANIIERTNLWQSPGKNKYLYSVQFAKDTLVLWDREWN